MPLPFFGSNKICRLHYLLRGVAAPKDSLIHSASTTICIKKGFKLVFSVCVSVSKYPFKRRQSRMDNGLLRL